GGTQAGRLLLSCPSWTPQTQIVRCPRNRGNFTYNTSTKNITSTKDAYNTNTKGSYNTSNKTDTKDSYNTTNTTKTTNQSSSGAFSPVANNGGDSTRKESRHQTNKRKTETNTKTISGQTEDGNSRKMAGAVGG